LSGMEWTEKTHSFFLESLLRPLKQGARVVEISGKWTARQEGVRHISKWAYVDYVSIMFKVGFSRK
jgi:hypothetical protein